MGSFLDMFRSKKCVIMGIRDIELRKTYGRMEDDKDENNSISRQQHQLQALWGTWHVSVYRMRLTGTEHIGFHSIGREESINSFRIRYR